ncbi:MAG TPA: undecaprenyl-diphosphatase [Clostridiales bacterium]|nr:undecaprenyl-diphosphatase [Clostridiales bacterium]
MSVLEGFLLGIIQGLTEFLPVSSSGHLVLFQNLFGVEGNTFTFDLCVHFATLIAVCTVYWQDLMSYAKKPFTKPVFLLIAATIPAIIAALFLEDWIKDFFQTGNSLGIGFLFTALVLLVVSKIPSGKKSIEKAGIADAFVIGFGQAIALFPAISRSGMTISASLARGLKREEASKFSFLMSIPVILGAVLFDLVDVVKDPSLVAGIHVSALLVGMIAAGLSGYFAVRFMIKVVNNGKLKYFSYYLFVIAAFVLVDQLFIGKVFNKLF